MIEKASKIVVIGGVACGPKAAARAHRLDPKAEITIIDKGSYISYASCGLPYYIAGAVPDLEGLMTNSSGTLRDCDYFTYEKGITVLARSEVCQIDRQKKEITIKNLDTSEFTTLPYDKLVLATGAEPIVPPIKGITLEGVYLLRRPEDAFKLRTAIEDGQADRICTIGAGRIALELCDAFEAQAVETTIIEIANQTLPTMLDKELADYVAGTLRKNKVKLLLSEKVMRLEGDADGRVVKVITDKREIETDAVLVGVGVKPNVDLAREIDLEIGSTGAVKVNEYLQTSDPDIYAGGDCVECSNIISGENIYFPLGSVANRHGRVIGTNIAGGRDRFFGVLGTSAVKTLGINIATTGINETTAARLGYQAVICLHPAGDKSHFFPGGKYVVLKLVVDANTRRILGAQAVGNGDVVKPIDTIAGIMNFAATIDDLANLDLAYAPPFSSSINNVVHCANIVRNKLDLLIDAITPIMLKQKLLNGKNIAILDIRSEAELQLGEIKHDDVHVIPVAELRSRINELPKDKELVVGCQVGVRAYDIMRNVLIKAGFTRLSMLDGGWHVWIGCGYNE